MPALDITPATFGTSGLAYLGSNHRLRAALKRALEGKEMFKIGVIGALLCAPLLCGLDYDYESCSSLAIPSGGSISHGHGASERLVTGWVPVLGRWLSMAFKNATIRNGSIPGTPSVRMVATGRIHG
jgi:hypothetical protein